MNKQEILKKFKKLNKIKKTFFDLSDYMNYLHYSEGLSFDYITENIKEIKTIIIKKISWDITTTKIKDYDKNKGKWFKTELALYEVI